jgi:hypothetical protein
VFHPRGFALALHYDEHDDVTRQPIGEPSGWSVLGDGLEPWTMGDTPPEMRIAGHPTEDELFSAVERLLQPRGIDDE